MGNQTSHSMPSASVQSNSATSTSSACPIKHNKTTSNESACPIKSKPDTYKNPNQYNVYSQKIDPTNQMPVTANQSQAANQAIPLETQRVASSIPKGGTDDQTWLYPSPQMFWNALVRKQKVDGATEDDMDTVVAIHNNMNENTWRQVLAWETFHPAASPDKAPKLLRFLGRPDELSPKARLKVLFGHVAPFDRHDWVVDRGGTEVRYIIDYYHDEANVDNDTRPSSMSDATSMKSIIVDVRPALDSPTAIFDRIIKMAFLTDKSQVGYNPPPFFQPSPSQVALRRRQLLMNEQWSQIQSRCRPYRDKLAACDSEDSCGAASIALRKCSAEIVCAESAMAFNQALGAYSQFQKSTQKVSWLGSVIAFNTKQLQEEAIIKAKVDTTLNKMDSCLDLFKIESQQLLKESQPSKSALAQLFTSQK